MMVVRRTKQEKVSGRHDDSYRIKLTLLLLNVTHSHTNTSSSRFHILYTVRELLQHAIIRDRNRIVKSYLRKGQLKLNTETNTTESRIPELSSINYRKFTALGLEGFNPSLDVNLRFWGRGVCVQELNKLIEAHRHHPAIRSNIFPCCCIVGK